MNTSKQYTKVQGAVGLYKYHNGTYYLRRQFRGTLVVRCLKTKDRKVADRKLVELSKEFSQTEDSLTLEKLFARFVDTQKHKSEKTLAVYTWVHNTLESQSSFFTDRLFDIKPVELSRFFSGLEMKAGSVNKIHSILQQVFDFAVVNKWLSANPLKALKLKRKAVRTVPKIPSPDQFNEITQWLRARKSQNLTLFIEAMGAFGLGFAEVGNLKWEDFDKEQKKVNIVRQKTEKPFYVPFYPWCEDLLKRLNDWQTKSVGMVFKDVAHQTVSENLKAACKHLGFPRYTTRSLRQMCIVRLLRSGIPAKLVAKFQGHSDGGVLIMKVYSDVISETDDQYEADMLARLGKA